jgi:hypothetical protein
MLGIDQQPPIVKVVICVLVSPIFFLCVGTVAFMFAGFGTAGSFFGESPKLRTVLLGTMGLGLVVTIGVGLIWGGVWLIGSIGRLLLQVPSQFTGQPEVI